MRNSLYVLILLCTLQLAIGQKQRLVGDNSAFPCKSDSIRFYQLKSLKEANVDSIISILYDYDNGRMEKSKQFIIWHHDGLGKIRTFDGCDLVNYDTINEFNAKRLFDYFYLHRLDTMTQRINTEIFVSHGMGHFIRVEMPHTKKSINVRNWQAVNKTDPRVKFVMLIKELTDQYGS